MLLLDRINSAALLRPLGISKSLHDVCVIVFNSDLSRLGNLLLNHPWLNIRRLIIPDLETRIPNKAFVEIDGRKLPCSPVTELGLFPELEKIYISPEEPVMATVALTRLAIFGASFSVRNFYLLADRPPIYSTRQARPNFFREHEKELANAIDLFADESSKELFASRIKAIISGNAAFMPVAPHEEYFHPLVHPEEGDIMIDGGVSDMVQSQTKFLEALGLRGHIFGFEPIPHMARKAQKALHAFPNYHLQTLGLADREGEAIFEDLRDSSHMLDSTAAGKGISCELTSIDSFCHKHHLNKVDCIKLDVEGAELRALAGGEKVIRSMRPKLIICLYHKPQDMYEIPVYIKKIVPDYKLYLAHSSCQFTDTILYALPQERLPLDGRPA